MTLRTLRDLLIVAVLLVALFKLLAGDFDCHLGV